jgi:hypothetical protein
MTQWIAWRALDIHTPFCSPHSTHFANWRGAPLGLIGELTPLARRD